MPWENPHLYLENTKNTQEGQGNSTKIFGKMTNFFIRGEGA